MVMQPLRIIAYLQSPPAGIAPFMLDGILLWGEAARVASTLPGGWLPEEEANTLPLPLAKVELPDGRWWYACSGALPPANATQQAVRYVNRRPDVEMLCQFTKAVGLDEAAGPDKLIRKPRYTWPMWREIEWTCIGDIDKIKTCLSFVHGIGQGVPQGQGLVLPDQGWEVLPTDGPPIDAYRYDARIRPLPADCTAMPTAARVLRTPIPLRPPYWDRTRNTDCWKVTSL